MAQVVSTFPVRISRRKLCATLCSCCKSCRKTVCKWTPNGRAKCTLDGGSGVFAWRPYRPTTCRPLPLPGRAQALARLPVASPLRSFSLARRSRGRGSFLTDRFSISLKMPNRIFLIARRCIAVAAMCCVSVHSTYSPFVIATKISVIIGTAEGVVCHGLTSRALFLPL